MKQFRTIIAAAVAAFLLFPHASDAQEKAGIVAHRGFWNCEEAGYARFYSFCQSAKLQKYLNLQNLVQM